MNRKEKYSIEILKLSNSFVEAINGNPGEIISMMQFIEDLPGNIRDKIFCYNLSCFLRGLDKNGTHKKKLGKMLAESAYAGEYGLTLLKMIDDMDMSQKVMFLSNLCDATTKEFVTTEQLFRYTRIIRDLTPQSLSFIKDNIVKKEFNETGLTVNELYSYDLVYYKEGGGYAFSSEAYMIDKYAISYADEEKYKYNGEKDIVPCEGEYPRELTVLLG